MAEVATDRVPTQEHHHEARDDHGRDRDHDNHRLDDDDLALRPDISRWVGTGVPSVLLEIDDVLINLRSIRVKLPDHRLELRGLDEDRLRDVLDDLESQEQAMWVAFREIRGGIKAAIGRRAHARRERQRRAKRSGDFLNSYQRVVFEFVRECGKREAAGE